jgi:hypothetical protein
VSKCLFRVAALGSATSLTCILTPRRFSVSIFPRGNQKKIRFAPIREANFLDRTVEKA